ncbi:TonB-dependent receptor [Brevundimonas sp.]|uniref:TonB-dependent receptor n=3 Tax=Brevundimonas sp. TaxID=1871086 RepID=UPI002FC912C0
MAQHNRAHTKWVVTASVLALTSGYSQLAHAQDTGSTAVDEIIVTAQKREQSIQDVPIAVSAFSAEALDAMKIEGGSELLRAVPNVSFSKSNFSMYNFSIRGIGTKALSSASDPAVAIAFNNSTMIRNRLFESEYMDVNRVEVLRGPQGTLYGRNATAGVVNMIPNLPGPNYEGLAKAELGNFGTVRGQAMVNIPVSDTFWVRAAGSFTKRDGFDYNSFNGNDVNDRDLWSTRLSAAWEPHERFRTNLIWEHFEEDDNRSRTGKQLCTRDQGPTSMAGYTFKTNSFEQGKLPQGCLPGSLYDDAAYGTPQGAGYAFLPIASRQWSTAAGSNYSPFFNFDPFGGVTQSRDLREVSTPIDPVYQVKNDVIQLNVAFDITDNLTLHSQTLYTKDEFYSSQDYMRFASVPLFSDTTGFKSPSGKVTNGPTPGGIYVDPQLGPSTRMLSMDVSKSNNDQFFQELRLQSNWEGSFNFSLGANYTKFETEDNYFVYNNIFTMLAEWFYNYDFAGGMPRVCKDGSKFECIGVDYASLEESDGNGHNYFRSRNVVSTESWAAFGEGYWDINPEWRLTVGLRYTEDEKNSTPYPSQLLLGTWDMLGSGMYSGGRVSWGYPAQPDIVQAWDAFSGRAVLDWKPTDDVMVYASYSRGYKGGGANPPRADIDPRVMQTQPLAELFEPEYLNAFEIGAKITLQDGRLRLNATAFYYDYTNYQVSQIQDRIALNENFDAESMGLEFEAIYNVTPNFRIDGNLGILKTRIADGEQSIDIMDRTQGNDDWVVVRPWAQVPSNCVAPRKYVEKIVSAGRTNMTNALSALCGGGFLAGTFDPTFPWGQKHNLTYGFTYLPFKEAPNGGRGFYADLGGNELPNAPRWTANVGAQYTWNLTGSDVTLRGDYYRQADSYFRVNNTEYDEIRGWDNLNITVTWEVAASNLLLQAYVKNVFDDAPIVDAFTNSDDTLLTTNVFTLDPRLWGVSLTKRF